MSCSFKAGTHYHGLEAQRRKVQLLKQYKFVLGLENIVQVDYVTEKFYQLFATGCGPSPPKTDGYPPAKPCNYKALPVTFSHQM